ncbi:MAG: hypothetical protein ABSA02_25280 [Trebonia sp.]
MTEWARAQDSAESFAALVTAESGGPDKRVRSRWQQLHSTVKKVLIVRRGGAQADADVTETAFRIATALHVWTAEVKNGERDHRDALNWLDDLLPGDQPDAAQQVFLALTDIAEARGPLAGRITAAALRADLERRGLYMAADPRPRNALAELSERTQAFLDSTRDKIAGSLHLPRADLSGKLAISVQQHDRVLLTGSAGAGKSVLARLTARQMQADGATVVAFSLTERRWRTIADIEADLHVRLDTALQGAASIGDRLLLIDGAEQAQADAGALLKSVLQAVPYGPDALPWHVLVVARDDAADAVADILADEHPGAWPYRVRVEELTDSEITSVLAAFSQLQPMARNERSRRLLRRPYLADLLARGGTALPERILAEEDVARLVFERLITRRQGTLPGQGEPEARADIYVVMANALIAGPGPARLDGCDAPARQGLVSDNILDRVPGGFRFSHDVLADYAVATRLLGRDGEAVVKTLAEPRRLMNSIRLWMQCLLADATAGMSSTDLPATWRMLGAQAAHLAATGGPRWLDLPYEALLSIGPVREALQQLAGSFCAGDGGELGQLLNITQRLALPRRNDYLALSETVLARMMHSANSCGAAREPGVMYLPGRTRESELPWNEERAEVSPLADIALSAPVIGLIVRIGDRLPPALNVAAARLICSHLRALPTPPDGRENELLPHAAELPGLLLAWTTDCTLLTQKRDIAAALAILAVYLHEPEKNFLRACADEEPVLTGAVIEESFPSSALARFLPDLLFRLAHQYFLRHPPPRIPEDARLGSQFDATDGIVVPGTITWGVSSHVLTDRQVTHARGPFAALLNSDPQLGLALVGVIIDTATRGRSDSERANGCHLLTLELKLPHWRESRIYKGTPSMWGWFWRLGMGAHPAVSAFLELRTWAARQWSTGVPVRVIIDDILKAGTSPAFVAVAVDVLLRDIGNVTDELDPFLAHPLAWDMMSAIALGEIPGPSAETEDSPWSGLTITQAVIQLVSASAKERQRVLRQIGNDLFGRSEELVGTGGGGRIHWPLLWQRPTAIYEQQEDVHDVARLKVRRWAAELNIDYYRAERDCDGTIHTTVEYPEGTSPELADAGGRRARAELAIRDLAMRATRCRDGENADDPVHLHDVLTQIQEELAAAGRTSEGEWEMDAAAAVAAILIQASELTGIANLTLSWAVQRLLDSARRHDEERQNWFIPRYNGAIWHEVRSAAISLPVLLFDATLRERADADFMAACHAVKTLAASLSPEVRSTLVTAFDAFWENGCETVPAAHEAAVSALREMIATAGLGPVDDNGGRPHMRVPEPLNHTIASATDHLDLELAAPGVAGLASAATSKCPHSRASAHLLDALIVYDLGHWPVDFAHKHSSRAGEWRRAVDRVAAERILQGDTVLLDKYLIAFRPCPKELSSLLTELAARTTTPGRIAAFHGLWSHVLDTLLPPARELTSVSAKEADDSDVILDQALLPLPPEDARWPTSLTADLVWRWARAYSSTPHLTDRLINVLARLGWLSSPDGTAAVLITLGTDIQMIMRNSAEVINWLRFVLKTHPEAAEGHQAVARSILDKLAVAGYEPAIRLQREVEA